MQLGELPCPWHPGMNLFECKDLHPTGLMCWCGAKVGPREPGDDNGWGCLGDINHDWNTNG
jgi:hypothetical protein